MFLDKIKAHISYLMKYGLTGLFGTAVDYIIFFLLIYLTDLREDYANGISLSLATVLTWVLAGKTLFRTYNIPWFKYIIWFIYCAILIFLFSYLLKIMVDESISVVLSKVILTALSFLINSAVFKYCILS